MSNLVQVARVGVRGVGAPVVHVKKTLPPTLTTFPGVAEIRYYIKCTVRRREFYKENPREVSRHSSKGNRAATLPDADSICRYSISTFCRFSLQTNRYLQRLADLKHSLAGSMNSLHSIPHSARRKRAFLRVCEGPQAASTGHCQRAYPQSSVLICGSRVLPYSHATRAFP